MRSEKGILDALKILQEVCKESTCDNCILRNGNDECGIFESTSGNEYENLRDWCLKEYDKPRILLN